MNRSNPCVGFRRALFCASLCLLALASLAAPSWAEALRQRGYYADFVLMLQAPEQSVAAGEQVPMLAQVSSLGPDTAGHPSLLLRGDAGLGIAGVDSGGCRATSQGLRCGLDPLAPGQQQQRFFSLTSSPDARGLRLISGLVDSELRPSPESPGQEVDATWIDLVGRHDVGLVLLDQRPETEPDGWLRWSFMADNAGPSSVLEAIVGTFAIADGPITPRRACRALAGAQCLAGGAAYLPPQGRIELDIAVPPEAIEGWGVQVVGEIVPLEGAGIGQRPRLATLLFRAGLFADSFGD